MLCTALVVALGLAFVPQSEENREMRYHDVGAIVDGEHVDAEPLDVRMPLETAMIGGLFYERGSFGWPTIGGLPSSEWGPLLTALIEPELRTEVELDWFEHDGEQLGVTASPRGHEAVEDALALLESIWLRDVELEVHTLDSAVLDEVQGSILSAEEVERLLASPHHRTMTMLRARLGRPATLRSVEGEAFVADWLSLALQTIGTHDPFVSVIFDGLRGGVLVEPARAGRLTVRGWVRLADSHTPWPRVEVDPPPAFLQLPVISSTVAAASAELGEGEGLLLGSSAAPSCVLIRARRVHSRPQLPTGLVLLDLRRGLDQAFVPDPLIPADPQGWSADRELELPRGAGAVAAAFRPSELGHELRWELEEHHPDVDFALLGKDALLRGQPDECLAAYRRVRGLPGEYPATLELELRFGEIPTLELAEAERLGDWPERLGGRAIGSCRRGDGVLVTGGTERAYVYEYDEVGVEGGPVEIPHPRVGRWFEGVTFWARTLAMSDASVNLMLDARWLVPEPGEPDAQQTDAETYHRGLSFPRVKRAEVWTERVIALDEWTVIQSTTSAPGLSKVFALRVRRVGP